MDDLMIFVLSNKFEIVYISKKVIKCIISYLNIKCMNAKYSTYLFIPYY